MTDKPVDDRLVEIELTYLRIIDGKEVYGVLKFMGNQEQYQQFNQTADRGML